MGLFSVFPHFEKCILVVTKAIAFLREGIDIDKVDDFVLGITPAAGVQVGDEVGGEEARIIPLHLAAQAGAVLEDWIVIDHQHAHRADVCVALGNRCRRCEGLNYE